MQQFNSFKINGIDVFYMLMLLLCMMLWHLSLSNNVLMLGINCSKAHLINLLEQYGGGQF